MDVKKKNIIQLYNLPEKIKFCSKCTISNQRPRIQFDKDGVCSACNFQEYKKKISWKKKEEELILLCDKHRKNNGEHDVIVPCSGGKDGSFVAHQLKHSYGMNPLCVTWAPLKATEIGRKNLNSFIQSGFNHILGTPDPLITRKLTRLSFERLGDPFQPFIYGQTNFPLRMSVLYNIPLIMYGENGEVEYGGDMKNAYSPTRSIQDHDKHYFSGLSPEFWEQHGLTKKCLFPFLAPKYSDIVSNKTEIHFFGYYKFWDPQENYYYCCENTGFEANLERTEGTYSKYASLDDQIDGFHYYLAYVKFGIGRTTSDTAHEIRDGKISRAEGILLIKRYDHEFPNKYYDEFLDYCNLTNDQFHETIDQWRSDHIWKKESNEWQLRQPIWKDE